MSKNHKNRRRERTCNGKRRFRDHAEATRALHTVKRESTREKSPVRAYPCDGCRGWHLTSQPARV